MDIIFQSGEFNGSDESVWWKLANIGASFFGAILSAFIAIYVFRLGQASDRAKETTRLDELQVYVLNILRLPIEPLEKQIGFLEETTKTMTIETDGDYTLQTNPLLTTGNIKRLEHSELYKIFVTNRPGTVDERTKLFQELEMHLSYIDKLEENLSTAFTHYDKNYQQYRDMWNIGAKAISKQIDQMIVGSLRTDSDNGYLKEIQSVIGEWKAQGNSLRLDVMKEKYMVPLKNVSLNPKFGQPAPAVYHKL